MHVRHVVRQFHPSIGGLEDAVANLAVALNGMPGISASVVTLDRLFTDRRTVLPATGEHRGVPITRIPFRGSTRYPIAPSVLRHLEGADIVHVHGIDFFFDCLALARPLHRKALVASTHGGFFHTGFASRAKKVYFASVTRASAAGYARIFGSSESDSAMFRRIAPRQTLTIENGVDTAKWHDLAARTAERTMIFIGRFSSNKAIPDLIALVAALRRIEPGWRLIVAGQAADLTAADLAKAAATAGAADAVEIVVGADTAALGTLIGQASYVASASRYEGFGLSMVEGLSAGLTPLMNRIPPFERLATTTGRGVLLDFAAIDAAARAVVAAHGALDADAARTANIAAAERYGWAEPATRFADEYRAVLATC